MAPGPDRRFRVEAMIAIQLVARHGTASQQALTRSVLDRFARGDDPILAPMAQHLRSEEVDLQQVLERQE